MNASTKDQLVRGDLRDFWAVIKMLADQDLIDGAYRHLQKEGIESVRVSADVFEGLKAYIDNNQGEIAPQWSLKLSCELEV